MTPPSFHRGPGAASTTPRRPAPSLVLTLAICCALVPALSACLGDIKQDAPRKQYFVLLPERPAALAPLETPAAPALRLKRCNVAPAFAGRELVYRSSANVFEPDYYNVYLVHPKLLLTQALKEWIEASGVFGVVSEPGADIDPAYTLESSAHRLYGDFTMDERPHAVVAMRFFLLREVGMGREIVFHKDYEVRQPMGERSPRAMVAAINQCLALVFGRLENDLARALEQ